MTCRSCRYEFCFICLKKFPCGTGLFHPCDVAPRQTSDTNFTGASDNIKKQLNSEEPVIDLDVQTEEQSLYNLNFLREPEDEEIALELLMDEVDDNYRNVSSSDGFTANSDDGIINRPDDVALNTNNDAVPNTTISASDNTVNADNRTADNTLIGNETEDHRSNLGSGGAHSNSGSDRDVAQLQTNNAIVQPNKTLETKKVLSSTSTPTSKPAKWRFCIIQ